MGFYDVVLEEVAEEVLRHGGGEDSGLKLVKWEIGVWTVVSDCVGEGWVVWGWSRWSWGKNLGGDI